MYYYINTNQLEISQNRNSKYNNDKFFKQHKKEAEDLSVNITKRFVKNIAFHLLLTFQAPQHFQGSHSVTPAKFQKFSGPQTILSRPGHFVTWQCLNLDKNSTAVNN